MAVFVLDRKGKPLMPCTERRARIMLNRGRARIHKMMPFTIRLVDRLQQDSVLQPLSCKLVHRPSLIENRWGFQKPMHWMRFVWER